MSKRLAYITTLPDGIIIRVAVRVSDKAAAQIQKDLDREGKKMTEIFDVVRLPGVDNGDSNGTIKKL